MKISRLIVLAAACLACRLPAILSAESPVPAPTQAPPEITPHPKASPSPSVPAAPQLRSTLPSPPPSPSATPQKPARPKPPEQVDSLSDPEIRQSIEFIKSNFIDSAAVTDPGIAHATLQGLLERLAPGISIVSSALVPEPDATPAYVEIVRSQIGYLRLGSLTRKNLAAIDSGLQDFSAKAVTAVILDLRATPPGGDYELAADLIGRFVPKGKLLFSIKKAGAQPERLFTSKEDPRYTGLLVALVDSSTSGPAEVVAEDLRSYAKAIVIGEKTTGEAVEFSEYPLGSGKELKVAVARVVMPGDKPTYPDGVKPDILVPVDEAVEQSLLDRSLGKGVLPLVQESERPRSNEHALVSRTTPEMDALEAAQQQKGEKPKQLPLDAILQRALDLITSIQIYESKPPPSAD